MSGHVFAALHRDRSVAKDQNIVTWNFSRVAQPISWEVLLENVHSLFSPGNTRRKVVGNTFLRPFMSGGTD